MPNYTYYFVGNSAAGGRKGDLSGFREPQNVTYRLHVCGNTISVYPAFSRNDDYPDAAVSAQEVELANVSGNTLLSGGHGVLLLYQCTNAIVLKNDFGEVTHRGIACDDAGGAAGSIIAVKNILGQGNSYHLRLPYPDSGNYFLIRNTYKSGGTTNSPFLDPASSPVHFSY